MKNMMKHEPTRERNGAKRPRGAARRRLGGSPGRRASCSNLNGDDRHNASVKGGQKTADRGGAGDIFHIYAREIGPYKLLTAEQEARLAARIQNGDEAAREEMIQANLRLVVKIAREFEHRGLPLLDLISEGNIGLMKAIDRFDPAKGFRLSTYAAYYIKQAMRRAIDNQVRIIRLPVHVIEKLVEMGKIESRLWTTKEAAPSEGEIAREARIPLRKARRYQAAGMQPVSLEYHGEEKPNLPISETVPDENASMPGSELGLREMLGQMREKMSLLTEREHQVLRLRYGLEGGGEQTLDEVGAALGLTRERIRQLQQQALQKMRALVCQPCSAAA